MELQMIYPLEATHDGTKACVQLWPAFVAARFLPLLGITMMMSERKDCKFRILLILARLYTAVQVLDEGTRCCWC